MSEVNDWSKIEKMLTHRERACLHLYHLAGWTQDDIAKAMKIEQRSVSQIILRAGGKIQDAGFQIRVIMQHSVNRRVAGRVL